MDDAERSASSPWYQQGRFWVAAYLLAITTVVVSVDQFRRWSIRVYSQPEEIAHWERWRREVARGGPEQGPVKRRVPRSSLPPALILMRDYYGICQLIAVVLSSALFLTFMVMIRGILAGGGADSHLGSPPRQRPRSHAP